MTELVRKSASASNGGELDSSTTQVIPGAKTFTGTVSVTNGMSARNIIGDTSGTAVPTGYIGETKTLAYSVSALATATLVNAAGGSNKLTLGPGTWLVTAAATAVCGVSLAASELRLSINTSSSPTLSGLQHQWNGSAIQSIFGQAGTLAVGFLCCHTTPFVISTTGIDLYSYVRVIHGDSNLGIAGQIQAIRIA